MQQSYLSYKGVSASYEPKNSILKNVSFELLEGELGCLLGPSGCGKTTILKTISGFQSVDSGSIHLAGKKISSSTRAVPAEKRNIGMVFQDHALFPHLTLAQNVGFGLHKLDKISASKQVDKMFELVSMSELKDAYPSEISGGQSQRIAIARALAPEPNLLLMDEPFSNLDSSLRERLGFEVRQLLKDAGITAIMVTHDQHDAFALGDKVGVIANGELQQWSSPFELYHAPNNRFVAEFVGEGVFIDGALKDANTVATAFGLIRGGSTNKNNKKESVKILLRPDDVIHRTNGPIKATVKRKAFKGAQTLYTLETQTGETLLSLLPSHEDFAIEEQIQVAIEADHLVIFENI
ncbi:MAG: ABC transporter ATP-binding protein [Gammaproteobacteria bacterium]|nr:ABC transporter ATP-binding protein [Gammaproteobacteria bacterium]